MDEKRRMRALMISDRLYEKLCARARRLAAERRAYVSYSQALAELLESMHEPGWEDAPVPDASELAA